MNDLRKDCQMRHENGNCTVIGGFCTAVNDAICAGLRNAYDSGYYDGALRAQQEVKSSLIVVESNAPLTLDELRQMDGEPVWLKIANGVWGIVSEKYGDVVLDIDQSISMASVIGVAYRRKPEEALK